MLTASFLALRSLASEVRPTVVRSASFGAYAGTVGRVDANGVYSIGGIAPGTFMLRARANGYQSRDRQVMLDSDVRVEPNYLREVAAPFEDPKVGAVTAFFRSTMIGSVGAALDAALAISPSAAPLRRRLSASVRCSPISKIVIEWFLSRSKNLVYTRVYR